MAAKRSSLWFGYLDAGAKGSLVVRDHSMDTGTPATIYLFNLAKGRILEYRRDIAEPKLRELTDEECDRIKELRKAFENARNGFMPRATVRPFRPSRKVKPEPEPGVPDFESDDDPPLPDKDQEDETVVLETD
jgi:hypothetical protein